MTLKSSYDFRLTLEPAGLLLATFAPDRSALERCRRERIFLTSQLGLNGVTPSQVSETDANFHEMRTKGTIGYKLVYKRLGAKSIPTCYRVGPPLLVASTTIAGERRSRRRYTVSTLSHGWCDQIEVETAKSL